MRPSVPKFDESFLTILLLKINETGVILPIL